MSHQLPDVQATEPDVAVGLSQVGVSGVEKLVEIDRPDDRPYVLTADFEVSVDLPGGRKGIDMSRNMEVIDETLEAAVSEPAYRVEDVCGDAAERLLAKHEYTSKATVSMEADFMMRERTPATDLDTQTTVEILASATAEDGEPVREEVGARVTGMTVCPCSQGMMASRAADTLEELGVEDDVVGEFLEGVPMAGHSQRGYATLSVEAADGPGVDVRDLVEVTRDAMSARIYNLAKRPDEDHVTEAAHADPKFVEDCVRSMAEGVVERFGELPDDAVVHMRQRNEESIHQHDAHAERVASLGDLREEVGPGS